MRRDIKSNCDSQTTIAPAVYTATVNGAGVDLKDFDGAMVVFQTGAMDAGVYTPKLQDSNDNVAWTDVDPVNFQNGALAPLTANSVQRAGYLGTNEFVRAVITVTGTVTTGANIAVQVGRGKPHRRPVP